MRLQTYNWFVPAVTDFGSCRLRFKGLGRKGSCAFRTRDLGTVTFAPHTLNRLRESELV